MSATLQTPQVPPLRAVRQARGLGLREVAARADIDVAQLSRVERGQAGLSVESLFRLSRVLKLNELERLIAPYARVAGRPRTNVPGESSVRVTGVQNDNDLASEARPKSLRRTEATPDEQLQSV